VRDAILKDRGSLGADESFLTTHARARPIVQVDDRTIGSAYQDRSPRAARRVPEKATRYLQTDDCS